MSQQKRKIWVDHAKAIAIYLVILAHYASPLEMNGRIYAFHIPLFFFLSGYLFSFKKHNSYREFFVRRFKQIVVPYVFYALLTYLFWFFVARHFGDDANTHIPFYIPLIGIFYGVPANHFLDQDGPLWFLTCLFVVENIYFITFKKANLKLQAGLIGTFAVLGYLDYTFDPIRFPWNLNVALTGIIFYALGNIVKTYLALNTFNKVSVNLPLVLISFALFYFASGYNLTVNFAHHFYGNYLFMLPTAFLGILFIVALCKLTGNIAGENKFISFIAQNTLSIMALDFFTMGIVKAFYHFVLKYPINAFDFKTGYSIFLSVITLLVMLPGIYLLDKMVPFLIGKVKDAKKEVIQQPVKE